MSTIRYFESQVYDADSEITEVEAHQRGIYVRAFFDDEGASTHAEVVKIGTVTEVIYYGVSQSDETGVVTRHRDSYPGCPLRCVLPVVISDASSQRTVRRFDADGTLAEIVIETMHATGDITTEVRLRPDGACFSRIEYEYDEDGELAWVREYNGSGELISEDDLRE